MRVRIERRALEGLICWHRIGPGFRHGTTVEPKILTLIWDHRDKKVRLALILYQARWSSSGPNDRGGGCPTKLGLLSQLRLEYKNLLN